MRIALRFFPKVDTNPEEIEEEINDWKDMDKLQQKANQFKPKLDAMPPKGMA